MALLELWEWQVNPADPATESYYATCLVMERETLRRGRCGISAQVRTTLLRCFNMCPACASCLQLSAARGAPGLSGPRRWVEPGGSARETITCQLMPLWLGWLVDSGGTGRGRVWPIDREPSHSHDSHLRVRRARGKRPTRDRPANRPPLWTASRLTGHRGCVGSSGPHLAAMVRHAYSFDAADHAQGGVHSWPCMLY